MIIRVVKLKFNKDDLNKFLLHFDKIKHIVISQENCFGMQLLQDKNEENIIFTYSIWQDESALNKYRNSLFFKEMWATIKPWFMEKAEAWTLNEYFNGINKN